MANLNDNEVREVARMQRIIDTLTSAIYAFAKWLTGMKRQSQYVLIVIVKRWMP